MKELKKFIDVLVPVDVCNFKCAYCFLRNGCSTNKAFDYSTKFKYSPEQVKKALTKERLGGVCHFNICGIGETLIYPKMFDYVKAILENGHTVMIVTNMSLTPRIKEFVSLPEEMRKRLGFKCSFHYFQLKEKNLLEIFFNNVKMARDAGCSISVELTSNDEYEPYIEEIKDICMKEVGAYCHVSVPRLGGDNKYPLMSKHSQQEYYDIWKTMDSKMFEFKMETWGQRRKEYCLAGYTSALLNLGTGEMTACYEQKNMKQNIFENPNKPIKWCAVGKCKIAHCYNNHSFLAFGNIPTINSCNYADIRDKVDKDGNHWLSDEMREQFETRLYEYNPVNKGIKIKFFFDRISIKTNNFLKRVKRKLKIK